MFINANLMSTTTTSMGSKNSSRLLILLISMIVSLPTYSANPSGDLRIEALNAPNFVVDSNIETPATYGPQAVHLGAHFCNDGSNDLTDVIVNIGNFIGTPATSTPGIYPVETVDEVANGWSYSGNFSLSHGTTTLSEATRMIGTIPAGECITQYWMITYPRQDALGNAVFGANTDFSDDLVLDYDFWATATDAGSPLVADQTYSATMRRELSAAANKIWPNTTSKVPTVYLDAIEGLLGWRPTTGSENTTAGGIGTVSGIWYDFGVVNKGFDNDGDLIPDYNAWAQPVGDPAIFDSGCFKLVKTYGILVIKHNTGVDELIPFVDQLYYSNIASDNTGMVGLVFYDFQALNGTCSIQISPYQEVASGRNNEKFNGDYGTFTGWITSTTPEVTFDKIADKSIVALGDSITYDLTADNTAGTIAAGDASLGSPLVFHDSIPANTEYVSGTAAASNSSTQAGLNFNILYSIDNGTTWTATEPVPATDTTDLQWWLDAPLNIGQTATVTFETTVPLGYPDLTVINDASLGFGSSGSFAFDDVTVFVEGTLTISGTVFEDIGTGGGVSADGILNGGELGHGLTTVTLYLDLLGNGIIDANDPVWSTTVSAANGTYSFTNLPDGDYIVQIDTADPDLFTGLTDGWGLTTNKKIAVTLSGSNSTGNNFGIAPALDISKTLNGTSPVGEGDLISYNIIVSNLLADINGGTGMATCEYDSYATSVLAAKTQIVDGANAVINTAGSSNEPEGSFAVTSGGGDGYLAVDQFDISAQPEVIQKVELIFLTQTVGFNWVNDVMDFQLRDSSDTAIVSGQLSTAQLLSLSNTVNTEVVLDVTSAYSWDWDTSVTENLHAYIEENKTGSSDDDIRIDAVSLRFTTDCGGGGGTYDLNKTLDVVPLHDDFDTTHLQFVSAVPSPTSFDNGTGDIDWNNVGPLNAGASRAIQVTFRTQLPGAASVSNVLNTALSNSATFANGLDANDATDDALVDIDPRVELSGTIWNDSTGSFTGWDNVNNPIIGYDGTDTFISGVTVNLYACLDLSNNIMTSSSSTNNSKACESVQNDGTWTLIESTTTDVNGTYLFSGLERGYYYVEVDNSSLPGTVTQGADPDDLVGPCGTCDDIWQDPTDNLNAMIEVPAVPGDISNINFGYNVNPALYGNVWEDKDGDGVQEIGELPLAGWTVQITGTGCAPCSTVTDANGDYTFGDLSTSSYTIITVPPASTPDSTWTETFESDASINNSISVTLTAGLISGSHDFAFQHSGTSTFGDTLFVDWNGNGVQDAEDEGLPGVSVNLYEDINNDSILDISVDPFVTTTSSTGTYLYSNLPAGSFFAVVDETTLPTGFSQSSDPDETGTCSICDARNLGTVNGTNSYLLADFGYTPVGTASIGDQVFFDNNGNGTLNLGDIGIANILLTLLVDIDGDGTYVTIQTTTTNASGIYNFTNLPDANYRVVMDTSDVDLPNDVFGNDGVMTTASSIDVIVFNGDVTSVAGVGCSNCSNTVDFGYTLLSSIGDTVFADENGNAIQDTVEPGIAGVTVQLYDPNGVLVDTQVTNANGVYQFTGIQPFFDINDNPLEYDVVVVTATLPAGYVMTGDPDRDGTACLDTTYDISPTPPPACDDQTSVPLNFNTNYVGADFGYQPPGSFGDLVWNDVNGNGSFDFGESGLANVTVTVTGPGGPYVTTTDNDGLYSFGGLPDGAYTVTLSGAALTNYAASSDPDVTADGVTTLIISGGSVSTLGGSVCGSDCDLDVDFGYQLNGAFSLSGSVCFEDGADNGSCSDVTDNGVVSQTVYVYDSGGNLVASVLTDLNGDYTVNNLPAGSYQVAISTTNAPLSFGIDTTTLVISQAQFTGGTVSAYTDSGTSIYQGINITGNATLLDFAFDFTQQIDFGDLPSPYATTLSTGGAYHIIHPSNTLFMGLAVDTETDGVPTISAQGDGADDADGVGFGIISNWTNGANGAIIQVQVGGTVGSGYVVGWIDFNNDGDFTDTNEMLMTSNVTNGFAYFSVTIPMGATLDSQIYSRFRVFENAPPIPSLSFAGAYSKGEVEDYLLDFRVSGTIGDKVWLDEDGDGIDDIFEPGIANVLVELQDGSCTPTVNCPTTTTDANGEYLFSGVFAGNYSVNIISGIPAGLSTAPGTTDPHVGIILANGGTYLDADFGYIPTAGTAVIGDQVFFDANSDGVQNPGEIGIAGVTLDLLDSTGAVVDTVTTLIDGSYLFVNVTPGKYKVSVTDTGNVLDNYTVTTSTHTPVDEITDPITILADTIYTDADFGYINSSVNLVTYTDRVWLDADAGADFDIASENGITGVTINLLDINGDVIATTVSDANGVFSFSGLSENSNYSVQVADSNHVLGTLDETTGTGGQVAVVTTVGNIDISTSGPSFGYYEPGGVSGLVWSDANADGDRDAGEAAISGVIVELQGTGCVSGSTCPRTTTAIDGSYLFDGYLPTNYTVVVNPTAGNGTTLAGYTQTGDPDVTLDNETAVTIVAGAIDENNDFGYQNSALADISGNVFYDTDADGVYEINGNDGIDNPGNTGDDEYGIGSVTIELQDGNGNIIATTIAAADGTYSFPDLPAGNYTVVITDTNQIVSGYEATSGLDYRSVTLALVDITDIDFGYVDEPQTASIGDTVWLDSDGDSIQDPDEPGIAFVGLNLYEDTNNNGVLDIGTGDTLIASSLTDANGKYRFDALTSGNYFVDVIEADVPLNLTATTFVTGSSDLIGLSEGEFVEDADFGFKPDTGTGALSGLVWSDDNSDGLSGSGEVGIPTVTITVYDTNNPGTTYTVDSSADGSWMITGLPAGNYAVTYDSGDIPAGYSTPTQPTNFGVGLDTYNLTLVADQTINNLDFGFDPGAATGAISGTVYNDLDKDSTFDNLIAGANGIEVGIRDVTLNLVDSNGDIVATTTTDTDGSYSFTGIQPGLNYNVIITDISGTLDGLNPYELMPTNISVTAGNTTTDVDAGYASGNELGSIGNLVFLDVDNSSSYQIGEPGIAGVSLECWSDTNENSIIEPGTDNLIRTVLTDENGEYYCNSVPSGLYVVRITDRDGRLNGLSSTGVVNTLDVDFVSNISPLPIITNSPNYKADFGYRGSLLISGKVFEDVNNSASLDGGDNNVNNAKVYLYKDLDNDGVLDPGEPLVDTRTTNPSGNYTFTSVPAGNYLIVPDTSGTSVSGYSQTTQTATNGIIAVTVGPNSSNNNFGFYNSGITTTPVTLSSFKATRTSKGTDFVWSTETETGNIGFKIYSVNQDKSISTLTNLVTSNKINSLEPELYSATVDTINFSEVWISDIDIYGKETRHGPYQVGKQYGYYDADFETIDWKRVNSEHKSQKNKRIIGAKNSGINEVDLKVSADGIYRVTYEQLLDVGMNLDAIRLEQLSLKLGQENIPAFVHTDTPGQFSAGSWLEFIGKKVTNNLYTETNVYRLSLSGSSADSLRLIPENYSEFDVIDNSFYHRVNDMKDEDLIYNFATRTDDPWYRDSLLAYGANTSKSYPFDILDRKSGPIKLNFEIWGGTDFPGIIDHHIQIIVNGHTVFDEIMDGLEILNQSILIDSDFIVEGSNDIQIHSILDSGANYSLIYTNWIGLEYNNSILLNDDYLHFTGLTDLIFKDNYENLVTPIKGLVANGLSNNDAIVYSISDNNTYERLSYLEYNSTLEGFSVGFADTSSEHEYIVTTTSELLIPEISLTSQTDDLLTGNADYIMISHPHFIDHLQPLVSFHESNGLNVKVVNIEDIYHQYSNGIVDPNAINTYLKYADRIFNNKFVLLVGADTFDYLNHLGYGSFSFIPSHYRQTDEIITYTPTDVPFVDLNDDNAPDIALGRFPVRTVSELEVMINKTIQYATNSYSKSSIFAADRSGADGQFSTYSNQLIAKLPNDWSYTTSYLDDDTVLNNTNLLIDTINTGVAMVNYFGHSGYSSWSFESLFKVANAQNLTNIDKATLVVQWGCWNAYHVNANANTLAHNFLTRQNGAAAVLGASALTLVNSDIALSNIFMPLASQPNISIGEALVLSKQTLLQQHPEYLDMLLGYMILGDPAIELSQ